MKRRSLTAAALAAVSLAGTAFAQVAPPAQTQPQPQRLFAIKCTTPASIYALPLIQASVPDAPRLWSVRCSDVHDTLLTAEFNGGKALYAMLENPGTGEVDTAMMFARCGTNLCAALARIPSAVVRDDAIRLPSTLRFQFCDMIKPPRGVDYHVTPHDIEDTLEANKTCRAAIAGVAATNGVTIETWDAAQDDAGADRLQKVRPPEAAPAIPGMQKIMWR